MTKTTFRRRGFEIEYDIENECFINPLTGQAVSELCQVLIGWSEQDPFNRVGWDRLVYEINDRIEQDPSCLEDGGVVEL